MKRGCLAVFLIIVAAFLGADELTIRLESRIVETWDGEGASFYSDTGEPISWEVRGSKFAAENRPRGIYAMGEWPSDLFGAYPDNPESFGVYGINGAFIRQGYNQVELVPGTGSGDTFTAKSIPLPGRVHTIDFWVWGSNYDYYTEFHFRDYQGVAHVLSPVRVEDKREPGSIKFIGWKNMFADMPGYIRQAVHYKPELANLSLTKIVFTTHPAENVSEFYIYVDHLKVLSDVHESFYDGIGLTDAERVSELWGAGE